MAEHIKSWQDSPSCWTVSVQVLSGRKILPRRQSDAASSDDVNVGGHGAFDGEVSLGMVHQATPQALMHGGNDKARLCKRALRKRLSAGREIFFRRT